jgi:hypothetical protein
MFPAWFTPKKPTGTIHSTAEAASMTPHDAGTMRNARFWRNATQNRAMARSTLARKRARVASVETFMR